ncbi:cache domain-containing protein [Methanosphaerula subterraneus]|uniref:cache domain-containing protein n=1 Tax=Methanosphaerula subterraneus TaxID=3350244 RepID=UPI003F84A07F
MKPGFAFISLFVVLALLLIAAGCTQTSSTPVPVTPEKTVTTNASTNETMVAFVDEAKAYAETHGKEAALAEFSNKNGSFVRGDLYIYAYDFNGTTLAHPYSPEKIGVSRVDEPDVYGHPFFRGVMDVARNGSGYVWFYYVNPLHNNAVEKKLGYVTRAGDDWWLGSGVYYGPAEPVVASAPNAPSTSREIKDFVDNAAVYARQHGREAALAAFSNATGPFAAGDVYIYALDYAGNALALPHQPDLVGTNFLSLKDASGNYYTKTEITLAQTGGGYLLYRYPNPAENYTVRYKLSYVRPVDDTYWIGAGIYTREDLLIDRDLRQLVTDAKTYAKTYGKEKALAAFNDPNGSFVRDGLYIFADDYNGTALAWPSRPDQVGVNRINETDLDGTYYMQTMLDSARNGTGMVEYYGVNPATNTTQLKISYVTDVDGTWLLGAGRYLEPSSANLRG